MSESSGGSGNSPTSPVLCKACRKPLRLPDDPFCSLCGMPQHVQELTRKPCLLCRSPLHFSAQNCVFCSAPQDPQIFQQTQLKSCVNVNCLAPLLINLPVCYWCQTVQPPLTPLTQELPLPQEGSHQTHSQHTDDSLTPSVQPAMTQAQMEAMFKQQQQQQQQQQQLYQQQQQQQQQQQMLQHQQLMYNQQMLQQQLHMQPQYQMYPQTWGNQPAEVSMPATSYQSSVGHGHYHHAQGSVGYSSVQPTTPIMQSSVPTEVTVTYIPSTPPPPYQLSGHTMGYSPVPMGSEPRSSITTSATTSFSQTIPDLSQATTDLSQFVVIHSPDDTKHQSNNSSFDKQHDTKSTFDSSVLVYSDKGGAVMCQKMKQSSLNNTSSTDLGKGLTLPHPPGFTLLQTSQATSQHSSSTNQASVGGEAANSNLQFEDNRTKAEFMRQLYRDQMGHQDNNAFTSHLTDDNIISLQDRYQQCEQQQVPQNQQQQQIQQQVQQHQVKQNQQQQQQQVQQKVQQQVQQDHHQQVQQQEQSQQLDKTPTQQNEGQLQINQQGLQQQLDQQQGQYKQGSQQQGLQQQASQQKDSQQQQSQQQGSQGQQHQGSQVSQQQGQQQQDSQQGSEQQQGLQQQDSQDQQHQGSQQQQGQHQNSQQQDSQQQQGSQQQGQQHQGLQQQGLQQQQDQQQQGSQQQGQQHQGLQQQGSQQQQDQQQQGSQQQGQQHQAQQHSSQQQKDQQQQGSQQQGQQYQGQQHSSQQQKDQHKQQAKSVETVTNHPLGPGSTSDESHSVKKVDVNKNLNEGTAEAPGTSGKIFGSSATSSTLSYAMATRGGGGGGNNSAPDKNKPLISSPMPKIFEPPRDKSMTIQFIVIVPLDVWEWEDGTSSIYLRFFTPKIFGKFGRDIGPFHSERNVENLQVMTFKVKADVDLLKAEMKYSIGIPYKYVVFSKRMEEVGHPYEFLYRAPPYQSGETNRLLKIADSKIFPTAQYRQFDTIIFPEAKDKSNIVVRGFKKGWAWFTGSASPGTGHPEFSVPDVLHIRNECLNIYLQSAKDVILNGSYPEYFEIKEITEKCYALFQSCYLQCTEHRGSSHDWIIYGVRDTMHTWLIEVSRQLLSLEKLESRKRLVSGIVLICCFHKLSHFFNNIQCEDYLIMLRMISLSINNARDELSYLQSLMVANDTKKYVIEAIQYILKSTIAERKANSVMDILRALPLYHFLKGDSFPNEPVFIPSNKIVWGDYVLSMTSLRICLEYQSSGFIAQNYEELRVLLSFDQKLLHIIPYICPPKGISVLCDLLPVDIAIACVCDRLSSVSITTTSEKTLQEMFVGPLACIQQKIDKSEIDDVQTLLSIAKAVHTLLDSLDTKLNGSLQKHMAALKSAVSLALYILKQVQRYHESYKNKDEKIQMQKDIDIISKLKWLLNRWIVKGSVIGGSFFGSPISGHSTKKLSKELEELKLWEDLLKLTIPNPQLCEIWENIVIEIVKDRVSNVPIEFKLDIFSNTESRPETPNVLRNIFLIQATEALDNLVFKSKTQQYLRSFERLIETKSQKLVELLGNILNKKYPKFDENQEIPFEDLLEWDMWPGFLKIYARQSEVTTKQSDGHWQLIYTCALSQFESVCTSISTGDITVVKLKQIKDKQNQMNKLCEAVTTKSDGQNSLSSRLRIPSFIALKTNLETRLQEFEQFKDYVGQLTHFLTHVTTVHVNGQDELLSQLQQNYEEEKISKLCRSIQGCSSCQVICFPQAKPLEPYLQPFYTFSSKHSSDIFNKFWNNNLTEIHRQMHTITFQQVIDLVWKPVFDQCLQLLDNIHSGALKLSTVDDLFKTNYLTEKRKLNNDLQNLQKASDSCLGKSSDSRWIESAVDRMNQYWDLCNYREAAQAFIKIRDTLKLTGDFSLVEKVARQTSASLGEQTLDTIDQSVVEAGKFLKAYAKDKRKKDCLEAFAECQNIVAWIKKETTDVTSLQNFVTVALATAAGGEGDVTTDKLLYLRNVGSGFGPLIYNLPRTTNYHQLQERCKTLWETLKHAPTLPEMMRTCEHEIDWYQSVKETQGSVEITSFGQMRNIITYGSYKIGTSRKGILTSRSEAIHLRLRQSNTKRIHKLQYTLDEVRDLESKLVLITGRESEERQKVDLFLDIFHSVCRIADVLISLQQYGNNKYIGWTVHFPCNVDGVVEKLQCQASEMEKDLEDWKAELSGHRDQFYELNYFTTPQLLSLREELGQFKTSPNSTKPVKSEVMSLLQCLSREITSNLVKDEVQVVCAILQEQELAESTFDRQTTSHSSNRQEAIIPVNLTTQNMSHNIFRPVTEIYTETLSDNKISSMTSGVLEHIMETEKVSSGPQPRLNEDDLTDKQKATLANLKESCGFSKKLILLAFERSAKPDIEEAIEAWCNEHEENFNFSDSDVESEAKTDPYSIPSDDEQLHSEDEKEDVNEIYFEPLIKFEHSQEPAAEIQEKPILRFTIRERIPIDENHPVVKELMEAGFSLEECKTAAEHYPDNTQKAMEYIMEDSEELSELFPRSTSHDFIVEDRGMALEEERYNRQTSGVSEGSPVNVNDMEIVCSDTSARNYLSILELGMVLQQLNDNCRASVDQKRPFSDILKIGEPNLLVATPDTVLKTVLSLYMEDDKLPLPTHEEVLICSERTTDEEVTLLWKRAMGDPNHFRIFCLVHAELLSYQVCDKALRSLFECSQGQRNYKLVIICSNEEEDKSHMISKLQFYRRPFTTLHPVQTFSQYLITHFISWPQSGLKGQRILASVVDPENSYVRVVKSERAGMGKSLYIQRLKEELQAKTRKGPHYVIIPVHGPKVTFDTIVQALKHPFEKMTDQDSGQAIIFHIDISPSVLREIDSVLFSLLILRAVCDSQGRIWRCHPAHLYAIEVTVPKSEVKFAKCTISLLDILPTMECLSPRSVLQMLQNELDNSLKCSMDTGEFRSPVFQRVYQYLRRHVGRVPLDRFSYRLQSVEGKPIECLQILLSQCGVRDPSWSELRHFVGFLDTQLRNCENSIFCNEDIVGDVMSGLKTFVVKFMIRMSKDFATSSLKGEVATENEEVLDEEQLQEYQIDERKQWEQNYHPYLFFNEDGMSITFVGFNATRNGDLRDPVKNVVIEAAALTPQLYTGLQHNQVNLSENYQAWGKDIMIQKIGMVMGLEWSLDPDETYVLTVDNVIKIMAIHMRFRCNIPVVIMGETGCGKTRLIRYMCDLAAQGCRQGEERVKNMLIMKIHGGTTENDIVKKVEEAEEIADKNRKDHKVDTVLFFDEANTTEAIGLIKEVMCDRRIHGRSIKADVKFIAACNPYRKHTDDMIKKLESAGLGFYVKATETQHKLGTIPLRELVYRVLDLPPSMRPLVYDFGQLNNATEKDYIRQIVRDRCQAISGVSGQVINAVADVLAWSQGYMRERDDECSFVSLRDIERVMIVFKHFCDRKHLFTLEVLKKAQAELKPAVDEISRALILAVSVCYHARLQDRKEYEHGVVKQFKAPLGVPGGTEQFCNEIRWCQDVLLDNMKLGPNIAKNAALRENVFMMSICIELRIPLFLVGKPGSSKSLAKSIVADSMLGRSSEKTLMKEFNQVQIFSYQCSQLSTPESVIEVFNTAKSFQKKQDTTKYVSVVVLDEVGLAEDSPNLPLKALHPLLEDGTEGADDSQQIIEREQRVAFIGISNWALDPAKMNRGVMVTRGDPDKNELELSARGICSNRPDDPVKGRLNPYFQSLAAAYKAICDKQSKPFFGLRDFYSLIKMLYWMCEKSKLPPTGPQLQHAIKRNFGGLEDFDTFEIFKNSLKNIEDQPDLTDLSKEECELLSPDCSPLGLIRKSLQTKETSWHGENRYLLFLTENYAALQVLKHYLHEEVGMTFNQERSGLEESVPIVQRMEPFVLFGSSFPKDREYTQVCRNINQIKICMETGRTVILLNLENLYESLYDLLNQYYIHLGGGQRYVDLGLQTHRVKCRVHNDFKLILIAEKTTVYEKFPTPLINRLEKHFVLTETVLLDWQKEVLTKLTNWVHQFSKVNQVDTKFTEHDAFVGYQNDTPASVIFQATQQLHQERPEQDEESEEWKEAVLTRSKRILLQMASPDALIRLHHTTLAHDQRRLSQIYFSEQHHGSIVQFLVHHLHNGSYISGQCGLLIQVTTHSHLLSSQELNELCQHIDMREDQVLCFLLQEFDTEMDFSNKISPAFSQHNKKDTLLIIQCDSGHLFGDLIACARYRIDDEREKANYQWKKGQGFVHVLFIIHLPRQAGETDKHSSSFVGFQGGSWISAHIDDIRAPLKTALTLNDALSAPISDLFYNGNFLSYKRERESRRPGKGSVNLEIEDLESLEINEQSLNLISEQNMETLAEQHMMGEEMETEDLEQLNSQFYEDVSMETNTSPVTKPSRVHHSQCYRLYNCIQAAVARMVENDDTRKEWAAHRVRLLLELIPQNPTYPLDDHTFYGALVKHIRNMLKERDNVHQDKEWVLKEALSGRKLQIGGTFQNVLERRLDEVIVPIFAAILSFTDHYSNLDLIKPSHPRQEEVNPLQQLWLQMFSDDKLCQFSYESFSMGKGIEYHDFQSIANRVRTPGVVATERFSCQFPFFWLVKEVIDSKLEGAKHTAGGHRQGVHTQLCEILTDTPVASILNEVSEEHWIDFYQLYLHDYLRSVHFIAHHKSDEEYEIIGKALHAIITGPDFIGGLSSLVSQLAAVHVVYYQYQQEIMWFGQLTTHIPGILVQLDKTIEEYSSQYMELPLYAIKVAINENNLALPLDPDDRAYVPHRLVKLQLCQNAIDSILTLAEPTAKLTIEIRHSWQSVRAVQFFVEHIVTKFSIDDKKFVELVRYAKRIQLFLKSQPDFTKAKTVQNVQKVLRALDGDTGKKLKYSSDMQKTIREYCKSFFMEVVSSLCFGQPNPPETALIKELLTVVFTEQDKTKDFSYSDKEKVDKVPVIRSFLLQLLLEHNTEIVREHLEDYFTRSQQIIKDDRSLCLLCIQCFEDALHKQYSYIHDKVRHAHQVMNEGIEVIMSSPAPSVEGGIHLQYLEGIAKLRYAIVVVAELLHCQHGANSRHQSYYTHETQLLLDVTKRCCINDINTDNSGPGVFLVKQLARQYGVSFLTNLTSDQTMQWIVPHHLQRSNEDQQTNDPFVIYQVYGNLRTTLTDAVYGEELDKLQKTTERLSPKDAPALMLGIYQVITGSCVFTDESKKVTDEMRTEISSLTKKCKILNRSLMWTAQSLINNTYCGRLEPMLLRPGMSPQNRLITDLIIHVVTALQSKEKLVILQPFIRMMNSPGELKGAYLPTMPEDSLPIVRSALGGAFYQCPNGHPYFVSECGQPMQQYTCPQCKCAIGGQNHQLTSGNRTARITDTTETGYALGRPDQREVVPSSERTLSPAACTIVRVLMHTSLLWASCNNEHAIEGLIDLTKGQVRPADLPLFFWQHLQCDINILSRAIGKSKDESCIILHMILKDIVTEERNISTGVSTYATLGSRNARTEWERCFNNVYIEPILNKLEMTLQQATLLLVNDKREDRDRLFYVIHERMSVAPKDILPHLWTYRSRITLEHLFQTLQTHKDTCPILHEFIQQEPLLRATQYLPGIVKLQQQMYELSHRRLDKTDVAHYTIREFIRELGKGSHTEQKRNQFCEKLHCVRNAWSLVKDKLKEHSRVPVDSEYLTRVTWDESLPLSYLIPTLTGPGVCTVALVDLLVGVHNDFIEKCRSQLKKKQKKDIMWREHKVPVSHIQHCHLLEYEHQLLSIVLSHCHYSLEHGKGQNVTYDIPALEKHVVDRFVHGKPLIQLEIPQVVYRKDVYTAETFANIRKNVSPQIKLSARQQTEIVTELRTMQNLRDCLDVVEIVIGFLSSGRTDANTELKKYVKKVLKMERKFTSKKAMEYCSLGHILSLWETISVQIAKTLTLSRQEPFDSLGRDFLQKLGEDVDKELRRFLRQVDIPPLLNLLYEFIETNVRHRNPDEKDWPLFDTLVAHLDNYGLEGLPPQFEEQFPQTITVGQAVATWKAIVFYQQQHEHDIKD